MSDKIVYIPYVNPITMGLIFMIRVLIIGAGVMGLLQGIFRGIPTLIFVHFTFTGLFLTLLLMAVCSAMIYYPARPLFHWIGETFYKIKNFLR